MKNFLIGAAILIFILAIIDKTVLKEKGMIKQVEQINQYEKIEDPASLPIGIEVNHRAPEISLTTLEGNVVSLEDYKGKKILLNFWASWCPPCKAEMPDMQEMYENQSSEDFVVLAVNLTNTESKGLKVVKEFVESKKLTFPILLDEKGRATSDYNVLTYPTSYFIDTDGVIRSKVLGAISKEHMNREMNKLP
ncbi:TlpA disulfide reductase family protein [Bacillus sp. 31A1R]|uniref:TlpA disulfide reductase family protein n=1 Tax=Robertmurraya mangrovi TaxID=3098077 RepID=A0ABU5J315_9BACI|nr:TlpA disulfide reductase family protein [Bacillus sp. 31A1R]MDZ5473811.1 TlpA disulfide reductase family protein [Bacillus sp. 31A1R]